MKKILLILVLVLVGGSAAFFTLSFTAPDMLAAVGAFRILPAFGGKVTQVVKCNSGVLVYLKPVGSSPPSVMWSPGTKGYLYNMSAPPRANQNVLGVLGKPAVCTVGKFVVGGGPTIEFYGSSK